MCRNAVDYWASDFPKSARTLQYSIVASSWGQSRFRHAQFQSESEKQIPFSTFLALPLIFPSFRSEHNIASPRNHTPQHFPVENSIARDGSTSIGRRLGGIYHIRRPSAQIVHLPHDHDDLHNKDLQINHSGTFYVGDTRHGPCPAFV
jgi:hypothetical protein